MTAKPGGHHVIPVAVSVHRSDSSAAFFDAAAESTLLIRRCAECSRHRVARRFACRHCGSTTFEWVAASGRAELVSWAANPATQAQETPDPIRFGLVELAEGCWLETLLVNTTPTDLQPGAAFTVVFAHGPEGDTFPAFAPATRTATERTS